MILFTSLSDSAAPRVRKQLTVYTTSKLFKNRLLKTGLHFQTKWSED